MSELEYRILHIIKAYKDIQGIDPYINDIAKPLYIAIPTLRYHLNKLERKGFIEKKDRKYILKVKGLG